MANKTLQLVDVLKLLGVDVGLDWDDQLVVTYPLVPPTQADLARIVDAGREQLQLSLRLRRFYTLMVFVGGPMNGKQHRFFLCDHQRKCVHLERGRWAVYQAGDNAYSDPRLHFLGFATSQAKGRRGVLLPKREGKA